MGSFSKGKGSKRSQAVPGGEKMVPKVTYLDLFDSSVEEEEEEDVKPSGVTKVSNKGKTNAKAGVQKAPTTTVDLTQSDSDSAPLAKPRRSGKAKRIQKRPPASTQKRRQVGKKPSPRGKKSAGSDEDESDFVPGSETETDADVAEESSASSGSEAEVVDSEKAKVTGGKKRRRGGGRQSPSSGQGKAVAASGEGDVKRLTGNFGNLLNYVVEVSNGKASCRKCEVRIPKDEVRVGLVMDSGRFGITTRWQHLRCTIFTGIDTVDAIDGFEYLQDEHKGLVRDRLDRSATEVDEDLQPIEPDELVRKEWTQVMEPPPTLILPILPYQKEGLGWMYNQEHSDYHGGILADEMGMGKTIQAISIILANRPSDEVDATWSQVEQAHGRDPLLLRQSLRAGTLVVCPLIALLQWQSEIARFTSPGALKVVVYHGANREDMGDVLRSADVVLTTYSIVEAEYRRMVAPDKVKCKTCGKRLYPDKMKIHRKYFCGDDAVLTAAQALTARKGRTVKVGRLSKKQKREAGEASDVDDDDDDDDAMDVSSDEKGRKKPSKAKANKGTALEGDKYDQLKAANIAKMKVLAETGAQREAASGKAKALALISKAGKKLKGRSKTGQGDEESSEEKKGKMDKYDKMKAANIKKMQALANGKGVGSKGKSPGVRRVSGAKKAGSSGGKGKAAAKGRQTKSGDDQSDDQDFEPSSSDTEEESSADDDESTEEEKDEKKAAAKNRPKSLLHELSWFRIILDEAHYIKSRSTSTANAVFALTSLNKWGLTGTPLQNRVGELYSLVRFLRMDPHAYYFCRCKGCECKSLHYRFGENRDSCEQCGHTPMWHYAHFNRHILNPIQRAGYIGEGRKAMLMLKNDILDPVLLRRTKDTRAEDIMLPPRLVKLRQDKMDEKEEDFYQALYTQSQAQFNTYLQAGTVLNNYAHIFDILIRLRQAVDHPYLVIHSDARKGKPSGGEGGFGPSSQVAKEEADGEEGEEEEECGVCKEPIEDLVRAECGCAFCRLCVREFVEMQVLEASSLSCPRCTEQLTVDLNATITTAGSRGGANPRRGNKAGTVCVAGKVKLYGVDKKSILHKVELPSFQSSTKLEALMEELHVMQARDPSAKAIVFSQFVNMLDLIMWRLTLEGIKCGKLSGNMSVGNRDKVLKAFHSEPDYKVLLISLKAGGVALNLTHANYIFLMDPWWNPAAEMQAIDRTHRIGQHKPIFATRLIVEDTIEERILKLQEKKQLVFDGTVGGDAGSLQRLTVDDLRFLFTAN